MFYQKNEPSSTGCYKLTMELHKSSVTLNNNLTRSRESFNDRLWNVVPRLPIITYHSCTLNFGEKYVKRKEHRRHKEVTDDKLLSVDMEHVGRIHHGTNWDSLVSLLGPLLGWD